MSLHMQAAQNEPGRCRRNEHGKPLICGREPSRKRTRTRWEAGPIVQVAKALSLHMQTWNEVVLACGMKLSLQEKDATHPIEVTRNQYHRSQSRWIAERHHCADHLGLLNA